jgi:DNA-binding LytR/AlgR family response regulator
MMLKAIAIDDEPIALEVIKNLAAEVGIVSIDACFTNAFRGLEYLQKHKPDLLFLDIKMPSISGLDLLKSIPDPPMVIFTTAYSEHAVQSFELNAVDYLLKPFSLPRFLKACNRAHELYDLKNRGEGAQTIFIKSGYEQIRVALSDILYAEGTGNYVQFVLAKQNITSRLTMNEAEAVLKQPAFVRIHRSYIVAAQHVAKIEKRTIWVGIKEIPVGDAYRENIEKLIIRPR